MAKHYIMLKPKKLNMFLAFKLPAAFICGVRVKQLSNTHCSTTVKHRWINQNPFKSMFWAVQGMAAELSTGALVVSKLKTHDVKLSMLVVSNKATFSKKATGRITFSCNEGALIDSIIDKAIKTGEGQTIWLNAIGLNSDNEEVSAFSFEWSIKVKR